MIFHRVAISLAYHVNTILYCYGGSTLQKGRRGEDYAEFVQKQEWIDQEITVGIHWELFY